MSRSWVVAIACLALQSTGCANGRAEGKTASEGAAVGSFAILGAHVLPMSSDTVLRDQTVLVQDGVIAGLGPRSAVSIPAGATIIDAAGRYLMPGLVDGHVHLRAESELASYVRHGVTTVINMRALPTILAARQQLRDSSSSGPRLFTAGPLLDGDPPIWRGDGTLVITNERQARAAVADHAASGYDLVKVYNNLDPALLEIITREAHQAGLAVVGHLPRRPVRREGLVRALAAGIDLIAHGEEVFFTHFGGAPDSLMRAERASMPSDSAIADVAARIRRSGAAVSPNLSFIAMTARMLEDLDAVLADPEFAALDPGVQEMWREQNPTRRSGLEMFRARERIKYDVVRRLTRALDSAGVPLLLGTDASAPGMFPGASAHVELEELVAAGLTPYAALTAGTSAPGRFLQRHVRDAPRLGRVEAGYAADLVLLERNPLIDVKAVRTPFRVWVGGVIASSGR